MGWETIALIGFKALSAANQISTAKSNAKAAVEAGNLQAQNKAKETALKAARQQVSFLNSGLTLEGTPMAVIDDTFNTGIADINQIIKNTNTQSKNIVSAGRTEALNTMASAFSGADFGSIGSSGIFNPITSNLPVGQYGGGFGYYGADNTRIDWYK